ncbi:MAG: AAA family ATPase, partial [Gallicola sp.]|nr:AAA family ATPase [Gallicola sp.]
MATIDYNITEEVLPIIPIRGLWIFPHNVLHFDIGREISSKAMDEALMNDSKVFLASQKDLRVEDPLPSDFYHIGTVAEIKQTLKLPNGNTRVLVEGLYRGVIDSFEDNSEFYEAKIDVYEYSPEDIEMNTEVTAAVRLLMNDAREYLSLNSNLSTEMLMAVVDIEDPSRLSDVLTSYLNLKNEEYFQLLSAFDVYDRMLSLHSIMKREIEFLHIENNINQKVTQKMNQSQKEYFLREQINVIRDELGDTEDTDQYIDDYMAKLDELELDEDSREYVEKEVKRLRSMSPGSPEVSVVRNFLDHVMDLPWGNKTDDDTDIKFVRKTLEKEHYGLEDVKQRIVEFIAVKKMKGNLKGPIICLVGPPGVGKTSISKSIAHSLNRKFISMRLGGVRDEAEIRGHRRTYIGAMPGRIITLLEKVKVNNPVFLLDEIDKLASDFRGDPASALLEVLDP